MAQLIVALEMARTVHDKPKFAINHPLGMANDINYDTTTVSSTDQQLGQDMFRVNPSKGPFGTTFIGST